MLCHRNPEVVVLKAPQSINLSHRLPPSPPEHVCPNPTVKTTIFSRGRKFKFQFNFKSGPRVQCWHNAQSIRASPQNPRKMFPGDR